MEMPQLKKISSRTRAFAAALTMVSALTLAACGSEDNADPPATSAAVANTVPSTILPPATTAAAPITTAPTRTPETTPPTSATATTQPIDEEAAAKQAVIEAAEHAWYVFNEAKLDPTDEQKVAAALAASTGNARTWASEALQTYRTLNRKSITSTDVPAFVDVYENSVHVDLGAGTATIELCDLGSNVMVEVDSNPDGSDRILDNSVTAYHELNTFELVDGAWLYADGTDVAQYPGALTCDSLD